MALNLAAIATITAKTAYLVAPTSATSIFTGSLPVLTLPTTGQVYKINSLYAANTGAGTYTVDVFIKRIIVSPSSTTSIYLAKSLSIATGITTVVITKDSPIYLEETTDDIHVLCAGSSPTVTFTVSYEILA